MFSIHKQSVQTFFFFLSYGDETLLQHLSSLLNKVIDKVPKKKTASVNLSCAICSHNEVPNLRGNPNFVFE